MDMAVTVLEKYPIKKYDARELYSGQAVACKSEAKRS